VGYFEQILLLITVGHSILYHLSFCEWTFIFSDVYVDGCHTGVGNGGAPPKGFALHSAQREAGRDERTASKGKETFISEDGLVSV
jgi:hypothetical protein